MKSVLSFLLASTGIILAFEATSLGQTKENKVDPADLISYQASFLADDPFHEFNQTGKKIQARRGEVVRLLITGTPKAGYHTYPVTKRLSIQETAGLTKLKYGDVKGLAPLWPIQETEPQQENEQGAPVYLEHAGPFSLDQEILILPDAQPGIVELPIHLRSQVCKNTCTWVNTDLKAELEITSEDPLPMESQLLARLNEKPPDITIVNVDRIKSTPNHENAVGLISGSAEEYKASIEAIAVQMININAQGLLSKDGNVSMDLIAFMLAGVFWGAVSLITPCVFPMIPITVSFFLKQSEKEHHKPVTMALVYSVTIVIVLTLAAASLLATFRWLSLNPIMNFGLGALFIFFALSLFGMYDIELPSGLARFTSSKEGKGGMVGTIFMALTFTIISFACVAPFLGGFGGTAGTSVRPWWHTILGALAFSVTFASPFFFLALFPTFLRKMPKSGSWLNSVKVVMGFLELGAAFKFFRGAELALSAKPTIFTFDLILGIWMALLILCGLYLLGIYRLPHDTPEEHIRVPSLLFASMFLGLAFYLLPALFKINAEGEGQRPSGIIYAWVDSFLLPDGRSNKEATGNLPYAIAKSREIHALTGKPKRIFLDFTGKLCTNCNLNENNVFSKPEFRKLFQEFIVVELFTDVVPIDFYSPELKAKIGNDTTRQKEDAKVNETFESKYFNDTALPLYAILEPQPDGKIYILGVNNEGRISNESAFAAFLHDPK